MNSKSTANNPTLIAKIVELIRSAQNQIWKTVNNTMVITYFEIGRMIVEEEQNGKERADYGKHILDSIAKKLTEEFGKGFSKTNLKQMRSFYLVYSIGQTISDQFSLSWSHYLKLMRITNKNERRFYEIEALKNNWSMKELQRQCDSSLYTRLSLSRKKDKIMELSTSGHIIEFPKDAIKDPYILEFLGLPDLQIYSENDLEQKLIDKLEHLLLELGTGFTFVARQKRITFDEKHFKIDLVFYNRVLKCFVLIDLKVGELKHQDLGQMQMYVNYFDREIKLGDENKTIGIVLCQDKSEAVVKFTLPENNEQIFASKYLTVLPSKEALIGILKDD